MGLRLITDVLDVLDRHGSARGDDEHAGRAIFLIGDPHTGEIPPRPEPVPPEPVSRDAVTVPAGEVKTLIAALIIAADYKRDRAEMCADCADQSCPTCESRLRDAQAYDHLHVQLIQQAETSAAATASHPEPATPLGPAADREAGQ